METIRNLDGNLRTRITVRVFQILRQAADTTTTTLEATRRAVAELRAEGHHIPRIRDID